VILKRNDPAGRYLANTGKLLLLMAISLSGAHLFGQNTLRISGYVKESTGTPVELVNIAVLGTSIGATSSGNGYFQLSTSRKNEILLAVSKIGYTRREILIKPSDYPNPLDIQLSVILDPSIERVGEVVIKADRDPGSNLTRIDPKVVTVLPNASGSFEGIVKTMMGVSSSNELSSQYSVRGGNFDENLVYVNDIEIYRPFLIRSGQQEGLSFINTDMVSSVLFSAGGFDARYGDRMSSVLDIRYKKPTFFAGSATASLMGGSLHLEGTNKSHRFSHITGVRYKTNKYLLNSLETEGDYDPKFFDIQTYLTYDLSDVWEISFLGNIAKNSYDFVPVTRETSFGTVDNAIKLTVHFEGQELDEFTTYMGAVTSTYHPSDHFEMKWIASAFRTGESESFDILGQYWINKLDSQLGSDSFADSILNIGVGSYLDHARNKLEASVSSFDYKGKWITGGHSFQWGARVQHSFFTDRIEEWTLMDSAGYSLPYSDTVINLWQTHFAEGELTHNQVTGYLRDSYEMSLKNGKLIFNGGIRTTYTDINDEWLISPRLALSFLPAWKQDLQFRLSAGAYHQPPLFKEFRDLAGVLHPDVKSQKSYHVVGGTDYYFMAWDRPFKFTTELYYKYMWDLIPYEIDNVRIRYYGANMSHGYAAGLDFKVNGEFVPGVESWANLSVMQTQEDIDGDTVGYIPRPTDQRVNVALFFQDYIPNNRSYKAHLNILFGSGLPWGPLGSQTLKSALRMAPYRRVDLGFSKILIDGDKRSTNRYLKHFESLWLSLEVFNLLNINNTMSHIWIKDISNRLYAIDNYLTGRRINIKLQANF
jgi:hypothetical protein